MLRLLLDTQVLVWAFGNHPRLGPVAREAITDPGNDAYVSAASVWEIAIKQALGKLRAPQDLAGRVERDGFRGLPVSLFHAEHAGGLAPIHRDPFDRLLVAQAQVEGLTIVTSDSVIPRYGVQTMPAER